MSGLENEVVAVVEGVVEDKPKKDMSKLKEGLSRYNIWKRELKTLSPDLTRENIKEMWNHYKLENGMPISKPRKPKVKVSSSIVCGA